MTLRVSLPAPIPSGSRRIAMTLCGGGWRVTRRFLPLCDLQAQADLPVLGWSLRLEKSFPVLVGKRAVSEAAPQDSHSHGAKDGNSIQQAMPGFVQRGAG